MLNGGTSPLKTLVINKTKRVQRSKKGKINKINIRIICISKYNIKNHRKFLNTKYKISKIKKRRASKVWRETISSPPPPPSPSRAILRPWIYLEQRAIIVQLSKVINLGQIRCISLEE